MIDLANEQVVPLSQLVDLIPAVRKLAGEPKKLAVSTLFRWTSTGVRGIRLQSVQCGGTRCSSVLAYYRFCEALTADRDRRRNAGPVVVSG